MTRLLAAALLACAGCGHGFLFRPAAPIPEPEAGQTFELRPVEVIDFAWRDAPGGGVGVVLQARSRIRAQVLGGLLLQDGAPPCGGPRAFGFRLDGQYHDAAGEPPRGAAPKPGKAWLGAEPVELELRFDRDPLGAALAAGPVAVDVALRPVGEGPVGEELCVRAPLVPRRAPVEWRAGASRWFGSPGYRMHFLPAHPQRAIAAFSMTLELGAWVGPVRLGVEGSAGLGRVDLEAVDQPGAFGAALTALLPVWEGAPANRGATLLALEGAWDLLEVVSVTQSALYSVVLQGPRLGIFWGRRDLPPSWPGFAAPAGTPTLAGLDVFVARWRAAGAQAAWSFGFGFKGTYRLVR